MERAEALGLSHLVMHPGAHVGSGEEAGLDRVAAGLDEVHARCAGFAVRVLVENTAGQGTTLGWRFEQLAAIFERAQCADRMDVCFDTCHAFAAGYPLATEADYAATFQQFDDLVGLSRLKLFHVNDSARPLGSRVDRHAGIGLGEIGLDAFRRLVNDPRFAHLPMVLETPKEDEDGNDMDPVNLAVLHGLVAGPVARNISRMRVKPTLPPADERCAKAARARWTRDLSPASPASRSLQDARGLHEESPAARSPARRRANRRREW